MKRIRSAALCLLAVLVGILPAPAAQRAPLPVLRSDNGVNSAEARSAHYVVMLSLDGFRYDYAEKYGARNLLRLGARGAWAPQGMIPAYPSLTFPNHYTLVTGLYPEHHGIVNNRFYDPARRETYAYTGPSALDGSWYGGVPLWSLAESQGMRTGVIFWPGSEAEIAGRRPSYYAKFDNGIPYEDRLEQALAWLRLPEAERPHLILLYCAEPDHSGHQYGPDSAETRTAVLEMDHLAGQLDRRLGETGLPVDFLVVSDHGMARTQGGWVTLDTLADLEGVRSVGTSIYAGDEAQAERLYQRLKKVSSEFTVYRRAGTPHLLEFSANPREGDPVVVATGPYNLRVHPPEDRSRDTPPPAGGHGYDPRVVPEMKASFFLAGPDIVPGVTLAPFENVNVYPLVAHLLGLDAPATDGRLSVLSRVLRDGGEEGGRPRPAAAGAAGGSATAPASADKAADRPAAPLQPVPASSAPAAAVPGPAVH